MKKLVSSLLIVCLAALSTPAARAIYTITLTQTGTNVVASGSGMLNLTALSLKYTNGFYSGFDADASALYVGPPATNGLFSFTGFTGPASFSTGTNGQFPVSSSGAVTGIMVAGNLLTVPSSYTSNTALNGTATYSGTFASLGFTPGTYTYTWGSGLNADSFVVTSGVPEPGVCAVLAAGVGLLGLAVLRRRRQARLIR